MGCGINREGAIEQSWQSNRAVRMENVGQTDVVRELSRYSERGTCTPFDGPKLVVENRFLSLG